MFWEVMKWALQRDSETGFSTRLYLSECSAQPGSYADVLVMQNV